MPQWYVSKEIDPEKKVTPQESPVIRNSPHWPPHSSAEDKAVAHLRASCCSGRWHGKGTETELCLQRAPKTPFSWVRKSGLASNHLLPPSLHPLLPFPPAKPGTHWDAASPPACSARASPGLGLLCCRSPAVRPHVKEPSAEGAFCGAVKSAAGTAAASSPKLALSL